MAQQGLMKDMKEVTEVKDIAIANNAEFKSKLYLSGRYM